MRWQTTAVLAVVLLALGVFYYVYEIRGGPARAKVEETLTTLTTARVDREIESAPTQLDQYGLDKPAADVTLQLKDGRRLGLQLGAKNPTGIWVYARETDKPAVFVVSDMVLRDVTRPLADFRDRTVLAFEARPGAGFELATREETRAAARGARQWRR